MKAFVTMLSVLLSANACATEGGFREMADSWLGHSETQLVSSLGAPHRVYNKISGQRLLTWSFSPNASNTSPSTTSGYIGPYGTYYGTTTGGQTTTINMWCEVTFTVKNGRVKSWSYRGPGCRP